MIRRTTHFNCPHCKKVFYVRFDNYDKKYLYIDSPFHNCPFCHKEFVMSEAKEWVNLTQEERDAYLSFRGNNESSASLLGVVGLLFICLFIVSIILSALGVYYKLWIPTSVLLIVIIVWVLVVRNNNNKKFKKRSLIYDDLIKESIKRCTEPNYIKKLKGLNLKFYPLSKEEMKANNLEFFNSYIDKALNTDPNDNADIADLKTNHKSDNLLIIK